MVLRNYHIYDIFIFKKSAKYHFWNVINQVKMLYDLMQTLNHHLIH